MLLSCRHIVFLNIKNQLTRYSEKFILLLVILNGCIYFKIKMKEKLTTERLVEEARNFCAAESKNKNKELYGVTDGKAVGTYNGDCSINGLLT